ncbi:nucleotide pyrophosphatase, partial [Streptomyces sp. OF8]|nr:nucleotide pyrophosphatase [Streptomyces alkaliterrae]
TLLRSHTTDAVAAEEQLTLHVPATARHARIHFRYSGDNNWYWAVDNVRLDRAP